MPAEIPHRWRLFLVGADNRLIAELNPSEGVSAQRFQPVELADFLCGEGIALEEVGEFLSLVEALQSRVEARMLTGGPEAKCLAMRTLPGSAGSLRLFLLSDTRERGDCLSPAVLDWGGREARRLGLMGAGGDGSVHALVVESDPHARACALSLLRKLGCRARGAGSAGEALALAKSAAFELVVVASNLVGIGAATMSDLMRRRAIEQWGFAPAFALLGECSEPIASVELALERPVSMEGLRQAARRATELREKRMGDPRYLAELPVLELEVWGEETELLRRLAKTLVAQGLEFFAALETEAGALDGRSLEREVYSLKSGADILQARRLAAVCERLLEESVLEAGLLGSASQEQLHEEFERFRVFVARRGLLRDDRWGKRV